MSTSSIRSKQKSFVGSLTVQMKMTIVWMGANVGVAVLQVGRLCRAVLLMLAVWCLDGGRGQQKKLQAKTYHRIWKSMSHNWRGYMECVKCLMKSSKQIVRTKKSRNARLKKRNNARKWCKCVRNETSNQTFNQWPQLKPITTKKRRSLRKSWRCSMIMTREIRERTKGHPVRKISILLLQSLNPSEHTIMIRWLPSLNWTFKPRKSQRQQRKSWNYWGPMTGK